MNGHVFLAEHNNEAMWHWCLNHGLKKEYWHGPYIDRRYAEAAMKKAAAQLTALEWDAKHGLKRLKEEMK